MSIQVKLRRGTTSQHSTFTGAEGEVTIDTDKDVVVVHDGTTVGGHPLVKASSLATVATSGDYNDLINKPTAGSGTVTSVALSAPTGFTVSGSPVTTSGTLALAFDTGYSLPTTTKQGQWDTAYSWGNHASAGYLGSTDIGVTVQAYSSVLANTTASFTIADETKLDGIQAGAEVNVNADWNAVSGDAQILNKPTLATVATTGAYSDLTGKPSLATVATTGAYSDLTGKPSIPTKTSDLTNDSGFITGYTETDPVVGAVNGLVKANGAGTISAAVAGVDYLAPSAIGTTVQAYDADLTSWAALAPSSKQDTLVSGTNIKSINSTSLLGSGDIALFAGGLVKIEKVSALPGSPDANTLYIVV